MKRKLYILLFTLIGILLIGVGLLFYYDYRSEQQRLSSQYHFTSGELDSLRAGDIIMRAGYGVLSESIIYRLGDSCSLSHCGIVVRDSSGLFIVHAMSAGVSDQDGMQRCSIGEFMKDSRENSVIVARPKLGDGSLISDRATYYLNKKLPFDHDFDLADSSSLFCSELIIRVLLDELGIDVLEGLPHVPDNCKFSIFLNPQYFDVVINHPTRLRKK